MRDALIIPTYGFITADEQSAGGRGTKARIQKARHLIRYGVIARTCSVPFTQKMAPKGRDRTLLGDVPLGRNVADYVRSLAEFRQATIYDTPLSEGTFDDTCTGLAILCNEAVQLREGPVHVHFVSDWSQLGRLWIIWHVAFAHESAVKEWRASFHLVPNFRTVRDVWSHEPPAYLKCLWLSLRRRFFAV